jgi:Ca2+/Na+ antiporter
MPTPFDVKGTITQKVALIILVVVVVGLVLAFTPLRVIGYVLLAIGAALYVFASIRTLVQQLR